MNVFGSGLRSIVDNVRNWLDAKPTRGQALSVPGGRPVPTLVGSSLDVGVIDVSGSMGERDYPPSRLEGAKKAFDGFIRRSAEVNPNGWIGLVKFSDEAEVVANPAPVKNGLEVLRKSVKSLRTEGGTNLEAGLRTAFPLFSPSSSQRIVVLTDGHSTNGKPLRIAERIKSQGIQIDIIG